MQFLVLLRILKKVDPVVVRCYVGEPDREVTYERYLEALEEMRMRVPDAYEYVLDFHKHRLHLAHTVNLHSAVHSRDFLANTAVAQGMKCRTLNDFVDDMEMTVKKLEKPERPEFEEIMPAALEAGS